MKSIAFGAQNILLGDSEVVVAGGMESMSNVPFYADQMRWGNKYGNSTLIDGLAKDGLTDVYDGKAMGNAAELCASTCGISREAQDEFAIESYRRAQAAWKTGKFREEVVSVDMQKKGETIRLNRMKNPLMSSLKKSLLLKPAFQKDGTVTAANASSMNDGAAAMILVSEEKLKKLGLKPLARILSYADAEQSPEWFTTSPATGCPAGRAKGRFENGRHQFWELNEAFSVVGIENSKRMKLDPSTVNIHGGAVALGHPLGCSGARILITLLYILQEQKATVWRGRNL